MIAVWIVVFLALAPLATQLSGRLSQGGFQISGSTSQNAINVVSAKFTDQFPASMTLVLTSPTLPPNDPAFEAVIAKAAAAAKKAGGPVVGAVTTPAENPQLAYPAARTALIQIGLTEGIDQVLAQYQADHRRGDGGLDLTGRGLGHRGSGDLHRLQLGQHA